MTSLTATGLRFVDADGHILEHPNEMVAFAPFYDLERGVTPIAYLNAHNVAGMLTCFDEEMEWLDVPMEVPYRGKAEIRELLDSAAAIAAHRTKLRVQIAFVSAAQHRKQHHRSIRRDRQRVDLFPRPAPNQLHRLGPIAAF